MTSQHRGANGCYKLSRAETKITSTGLVHLQYN